MAEITVEIQNRHFSDATVYAVQGGQRQRIGRVSGKTNQSVTFRWPAEQLQMLVTFTGQRRSRLSDAVAVYPGIDDILLIIGSAGSLWAGRKTG